MIWLDEKWNETQRDLGQEEGEEKERVDLFPGGPKGIIKCRRSSRLWMGPQNLFANRETTEIRNPPAPGERYFGTLT